MVNMTGVQDFVCLRSSIRVRRPAAFCIATIARRPLSPSMGRLSVRPLTSDHAVVKPFVCRFDAQGPYPSGSVVQLLVLGPAG